MSRRNERGVATLWNSLVARRQRWENLDPEDSGAVLELIASLATPSGSAPAGVEGRVVEYWKNIARKPAMEWEKRRGVIRRYIVGKSGPDYGDRFLVELASGTLDEIRISTKSNATTIEQKGMRLLPLGTDLGTLAEEDEV